MVCRGAARGSAAGSSTGTFTVLCRSRAGKFLIKGIVRRINRRWRRFFSHPVTGPHPQGPASLDVGEVYVFIRTWNRPLHLWACLDSVYRSTKYPCRFILLDNHSTDPMVKRWWKDSSGAICFTPFISWIVITLPTRTWYLPAIANPWGNTWWYWMAILLLNTLSPVGWHA